MQSSSVKFSLQLRYFSFISLLSVLEPRRSGTKGFFLYKRHRFQNVYELGALQGWPRCWVDNLLNVEAKSTVAKAFGDAMSLNVLMRILPRALASAGLLAGDEFKDVWEAIPARGRLPGEMYVRPNPVNPKFQPVWF